MQYKNILKKPKPVPSSVAIKLFIAIMTCAALIFIIYVGRVPYGSLPQIGKVSERDIYAPFDFSYDSGIDVEKTEKMKEAAALGVKDVYDIDADAYERAAQNVKNFFVSSQSPESEKDETALLNKLAGIFSQGVISPQEKENLAKQGKETITIRNLSSKTEFNATVKDLKAPEELKSQVASAIAAKTLAPNLKSNVVETSSRREKAIAAIEPQKKLIDVKKDEILIQRGERFTHFHVAKLETIRSMSLEGERFALSVLGISLIVVTLIIVLSIYFVHYEPKIYSNNRHLMLLSFIILTVAAIGKGISLSGGPAYYVPVAIGPMLIALLLGARPAIVIAIFSSLLAGLIAGEKFDSTLIFLAGSIIGIYAVRGVRRRSQLFKAGVFVGATNVFCVIGLGILNNIEASLIFKDSLWFLVNGFAVGAMVTGTLHIFESISQITTNITLLELADPNNPLLKELILKAPGTYHHSLIVGNLAEAACDTIGANGLLARVGAYYHDIGKVEKSEYFAENQPITESQHDKLEPTMSSLIIINHVKEGLEKAKKARLNRALLDFIEQHHGTGLIYYFYQRALESVEDLAKLEEEGFRYPGPKPQTKETAIVHLADSVEAASRTLANPTPANLEELVRRIINNKFIDGQLDECELTLKDLNMIAVTFTKVLTGVYHTRIQYPNGNQKNGG